MAGSSGEGSRGGRIIGHTRSGRAIYAGGVLASAGAVSGIAAGITAHRASQASKLSVRRGLQEEGLMKAIRGTPSTHTLTRMMQLGVESVKAERKAETLARTAKILGGAGVAGMIVGAGIILRGRRQHG